MRMWMVDPELLCNQHLLGEHGEIHKHRHNFVKGHNISGRLQPIVQVEPASMGARHDELAEEMLKRGMNHRSPFEQPDLACYSDEQVNARVDISVSLKDLQDRCDECKKRITKRECHAPPS